VVSGDRSIELWIAALHRRRGNERLNAARALAGAGRDAVEPLAGALRSPDVEVRMLAATALGQIGAPASGAVPALNEAADDPSALVRVWANYALARIDWRDPAALEALRRSQEDADEQVRQAATRALANLERP
jgi:HEAT repeat protein